MPEVAHIPSFYHKGSKLSLFLLYGQRCPRYRPFFKIAIFGQETWPSAKVPEVAHITSFHPRGAKLSLFFARRAAVSEIRADFQNCHIWGAVSNTAVFKALNGLAPAYLSRLLHTYKPKRDLRSTSAGLLIEPRYRLNTYGGRSFQSMAPRLWNSLPVELRKIKTVTRFESELKTHLFRKTYY